MTGYLVAGGVVAVLVALRPWLVRVTVRGDSMTPTLRPGDRVLVRRTRVIRRGDLVVFPPPREPGTDRWLVKRVLAAPGDPIPRAAVPVLRGYPGDRVPSARLVVVGDNPTASYDSRQFGYVDAGTVLGRVVGRPARCGRAVRHPRPARGSVGHR